MSAVVSAEEAAHPASGAAGGATPFALPRLNGEALELARTCARGGVSKPSGKAAGSGGFVGASQSAKTLVFAGAFAAGRLKEGDGRAVVANEGRAKKLVRDVEQASFWGSAASKFGRRVLRVTERAVFTLDGERLTQREGAPGVGLRREALDQIEFTPEIDDDLKETDPGACAETRGGLVSVMDEKAA